jgi:hypothetical protein
MDLTLGMAFRCMAEPRHIYIPLFDPNLDADEMLLVNFTTLREKYASMIPAFSMIVIMWS